MILIEGKCREQMKQEKQEEWKTLSVKQHVDYYLDKGMDKKEAMLSLIHILQRLRFVIQ